MTTAFGIPVVPEVYMYRSGSEGRTREEYPEGSREGLDLARAVSYSKNNVVFTV